MYLNANSLSMTHISSKCKILIEIDGRPSNTTHNAQLSFEQNFLFQIPLKQGHHQTIIVRYTLDIISNNGVRYSARNKRREHKLPETCLQVIIHVRLCNLFQGNAQVLISQAHFPIQYESLISSYLRVMLLWVWPPTFLSSQIHV